MINTYLCIHSSYLFLLSISVYPFNQSISIIIPDVYFDDLPRDGAAGAHEGVGLLRHHSLPVPREHVPEKYAMVPREHVPE